jgi:hypothetical protein
MCYHQYHMSGIIRANEAVASSSTGAQHGFRGPHFTQGEMTFQQDARVARIGSEVVGLPVYGFLAGALDEQACNGVDGR